LDKNPLSDIINTKTVRGVVQGGRYFDRKQLDQLLEEVKNLKSEEVEFLDKMF
jgi:hypothetical protein